MQRFLKNKYTFFGGIGVFVLFLISTQFSATIEYAETIPGTVVGAIPVPKTLDAEAYNKKVLSLVNDSLMSTTTASTTVNSLWPADAPVPLAGAILPFKRVVAYYGNLYSTKMGALGEYPEDQMLAMLENEAKNWETADPDTPVQPALHYIVTTAQASPGADGKYRLRMPDSEIDKVLAMAKKIDAIVFLDIQLGLSTIQEELPLWEKYLSMPEVHLGLDPEFDMKNGKAPGTVIGTMDASEINYAAKYLADLVQKNNLPPKILVIHRFTQNMVTNYQNITPLPEVQIVMHMDGWGFKAKKIDTYKQVIYPEPVQFTGLKIFYKNDLKNGSDGLMTPYDALQLSPQPIYIQYQ